VPGFTSPGRRWCTGWCPGPFLRRGRLCGCRDGR